MPKINEAKTAWVLWQRYDCQFLEFVMKEKDKKHINQLSKPHTHL